MTVETAFFIKDLNETFPRSRDLISEGDDHIRLIKSSIKNTFPGIDRAVTFTADDLNKLDANLTVTDFDVTLDSNLTIGTGKVVSLGGGAVKNVGTPVDPTDAVNMAFLQGSATWPVGSIYLSIDARNPNAIFGFGTWQAFSQGRVIIGSGSTSDINNETRLFSNGAVGGEYTHHLSIDELPSHTFSVSGLSLGSSGGHRHGLPAGGGSSGPRQYLAVDSSLNNSYDWKGPLQGGTPATYDSGDHSHPITGSLPSIGSDTRHNNIQPFIVCNIWVRTA